MFLAVPKQGYFPQIKITFPHVSFPVEFINIHVVSELCMMKNSTCVGKYIIIFQGVIITFLSVSIVFVIMITGLAFSFHILLSNRDEFATPYDATLKAFMTMSGISLVMFSAK